jgi:hypothetical protein
MQVPKIWCQRPPWTLQPRSLCRLQSRQRQRQHQLLPVISCLRRRSCPRLYFPLNWCAIRCCATTLFVQPSHRIKLGKIDSFCTDNSAARLQPAEMLARASVQPRRRVFRVVAGRNGRDPALQRCARAGSHPGYPCGVAPAPVAALLRQHQPTVAGQPSGIRINFRATCSLSRQRQHAFE